MMVKLMSYGLGMAYVCGVFCCRCHKRMNFVQSAIQQIQFVQNDGVMTGLCKFFLELAICFFFLMNGVLSWWQHIYYIEKIFYF